jgi:solute carrier family 25 protein 16
MPSALVSHASMPGLPRQQPQDTRDVILGDGAARSGSRSAAVRETDEQSIGGRRVAVDKRSFDFLWRSGVAGGVAGCAVSYPSP